MNLYEIDEQITAAFNAAVDPETGEIINEDASNALDALVMERDRKIENIALWVKDLKAEAAALKAEKQAFADRQSAAEKKAAALSGYLSRVLNGEKFTSGSKRVAITWRKSESVEYDGDIAMLPDTYIRVKEPELNRDALKKALKNGISIPGARLVANNNIQIK